MNIWPFAALAAAGAAFPAQADITATYVTDGPGLSLGMKVEIAAGGDLRADMNIPGASLIRRSGRTYFVTASPTGPVVSDMEDMGAVFQEQLRESDSNLCDEIGRADSTARLVARGTATIAGRPGEAYGIPSRERPEVVISHDPALAPLGAAMATQFRVSTAVVSPCAAQVPMVAQMQSLLDSGTPLQFGPMHLETVETGTIDQARFVLPAAPASREEIRALMKRQSGARVTIVTSPPEKP